MSFTTEVVARLTAALEGWLAEGGPAPESGAPIDLKVLDEDAQQMLREMGYLEDGEG